MLAFVVVWTLTCVVETSKSFDIGTLWDVFVVTSFDIGTLTCIVVETLTSFGVETLLLGLYPGVESSPIKYLRRDFFNPDAK